AAVSRRWGWDEIVCAVVAIGKSGPDVTEHSHYDFIIIGGGPAGQGAAEFATLAGLRTLVIERNILGGLVVTTGGAPTKTLREAALYLTGFRERALYGLTAPADIVLAVERMRARTAQVRSAMQDITRSFFDDLGVEVAYGSARLGPGRTVLLTPRDGDGKECFLTAERILLVTGSRPSRPPNIPFDDPDVFDSEGLGLEAAGVKLNARGAVAVSDKFETSVDGIYAAGDLIGPSLSSISMEQGRVAACHAFDLRFKEKMDPLPVSAVYSVPEVAGVGLTEDNAKKQRINYEVGRCSFATIPRGIIAGHSEGLLKLVFRKDDRRLLGVHILGEIASELIGLGQATIHTGGTIDVFNRLTFATPTYTMAYKFAAFDGLKRLAGESEPSP